LEVVAGGLVVVIVLCVLVVLLSDVNGGSLVEVVVVGLLVDGLVVLVDTVGTVVLLFVTLVSLETPVTTPDPDDGVILILINGVPVGVELILLPAVGDGSLCVVLSVEINPGVTG